MIVSNEVKWLEYCDCDQHDLNSKPTCAILLFPGEKQFMALYPAWWSWQAALNFSHISIKLKNQNKKFQVDSSILASLEARQGNCLPYVLASSLLSCELVR